MRAENQVYSVKTSLYQASTSEKYNNNNLVTVVNETDEHCVCVSQQVEFMRYI